MTSKEKRFKDIIGVYQNSGLNQGEDTLVSALHRLFEQSEKNQELNKELLAIVKTKVTRIFCFTERYKAMYDYLVNYDLNYHQDIVAENNSKQK